MGASETVLAKILIGMIAFYRRFISPMLGHNCRFVPSCSEYAQDAVRAHGVKALPMIGARLCKCHPFTKNTYQYDPAQKAKP